jgi:hypothetical protein
MNSHKLETAERIMGFMFAGNATLTLASQKTGNRFTYKIVEGKPNRDNNKPIFFVSAMNGSDNENSFGYLGILKEFNGKLGFSFAKPDKAKIHANAPSAKAFQWAMTAILKFQTPDTLDVWHEGRCGRCNRKLTVPESIESGLGPECASKV